MSFINTKLSEEAVAEINNQIEQGFKSYLYEQSLGLHEQIADLKSEVQRLEHDLASQQPPAAHQVKAWEEGKKALNKIAEEREQAYNQGYAAAYIDITNRMTPGNTQYGAFND